MKRGFSLIEVLFVLACFGCVLAWVPGLLHALSRFNRSDEVAYAQGALECLYAYLDADSPQGSSRIQALEEHLANHPQYVLYWKPGAFELEPTPPDGDHKRIRLERNDARSHPRALYAYACVGPHLQKVPVCFRRAS